MSAIGKISTLNSIFIKKFRGLENINIPIARRLTLISGKNATSKSTLLGIIAHTFNNKEDYEEYKTITGSPFVSVFTEHFKLSEEYDPPHSMEVEGDFFDAKENENITFSQELGNYTKQNNRQRVVVRQKVVNTKEKRDRKIRHPIIYLGLKRLLPIVEREGVSIDLEYLNKTDIAHEFKTLSDRILLKNPKKSKRITATDSKVTKSAVAHTENYDSFSASAGEDNIGQIILAILSFKKLKEELEANGKTYRGGILLIDEIENSLFPAAQEQLLGVLNEYATKYSLQVIMTTHSPTLIEEVLKLNKSNNVIHYLTNSFGKIDLKTNWTWEQIKADIYNQTLKSPTKEKINRIDVYLEDAEAKNLYNVLLSYNKVKKFLNNPIIIKGFGCSEYLRLVEKVKPFRESSIVVLDGDLKKDKNKDTVDKLVVDNKKHPNVLTLPTSLPPDQLLFLILHNLPDNSDFWENKIMFTKVVFSRVAEEIYRNFDIDNQYINFNDFEKIIDKYRKNISNNGGKGKKARDIFKDFYKESETQEILKAKNPFKFYFDTDEGKLLKNEFISNLELQLKKKKLII